MSAMGIIITVLVLAMMVGPVMMLQPSARQKNLAKGRAQANALGLKVRMDKVKDDTVAVYSLPWEREIAQQYDKEAWCFLRQSYEHGIHLSKYWAERSGKTAPVALKHALEPLLETLPESVIGVEVNMAGVSLYWEETQIKKQLPQLHQWLKTCAQTLIAAFVFS